MSDIRINGGNQTSYTPTVGTQSVPTSQVKTTSGVTATTPEDEGPLLGTDNSESVPPEGDVPDPTAAEGAPDPNGDPMLRAAYLEQELEKQEDYAELYDQLLLIAESGGPDAAKSQELANKLKAQMWLPSEIEDAQEELDDLVDMLPDGDLDGDGVANEDDPDIDGDKLTNEAELANGTDVYNQDSDHDGIIDYGELWLKQHNYSFGWMDPNNPDANSNGILDGDELPASVKVDNNGNPIVVGYKPEGAAGTSGGAPGGGPVTGNYQWNPPSSEAQSINAADGDATVSADFDVVINANGGNLDFSKDGNDLVIQTSTGNIRVTGYYGADGKPKGKVFVEGAADSVSTSNGSNMFTTSDTNGDGYADAGIHFSSGVNTSNVTNNYDPAGGDLAIDEAASTDDMVAYEAGSAAINVPSEIGGTKVEAVELKVEGEYVIMILKGSLNGEPLKPTFRFRKADVENGNVHFKLADGEGQSFYSADAAATVDGGTGDDKIVVKGSAETTIRGNAGNDWTQVTGSAGGNAEGGEGDDFVLGGAGVDNLNGGDGWDFLSSGTSTGDTMIDMAGNNIFIVNNTASNAVYNVQAGDGQDMINSANIAIADAAHGFEVTLANPAGIVTFLQQHKTDANSNLLEELEKLYNDEDGGLTGWMSSAASETVKQAASAYLIEKESQWDAKYGGTHGDGFNASGTGGGSNPAPAGGGNPPAGGGNPPAEGGDVGSQSTFPGLMFQSMNVEEERRRRLREEGLAEDGDIPSPVMFE